MKVSDGRNERQIDAGFAPRKITGNIRGNGFLILTRYALTNGNEKNIFFSVRLKNKFKLN